LSTVLYTASETLPIQQQTLAQEFSRLGVNLNAGSNQ
jgi:hypothetical protein